MNILDPWNALFFVCLVIYFRIRGVFIKQTKDEKKLISKMDRLEKVLLAAMFPPILLFPILYLFTPVFSFADYPIPMGGRILGLIILVASLWLFRRSHLDLGLNWSVSLEIRENHNLVTQGVYRFIRHPMYASIWLWAIGQGLILENWIAGWLVVPAFAALYVLRLPKEETMMQEKFGEEYVEYSRRTGRLIPRFKGMRNRSK